MVTLGPLTLANMAGAWGFLAIIPLILLYLIRPRPVRMQIPSLMFLLQSKSNPRQSNFLKKITKDWLFLLQLLILLLLAFHLMEPFTEYEHDISSKNSVIVLDISASSQVQEGRTTRFNKGINLAKESLGGANTIILAKGTPKIVGVDLQHTEALETLNALTPTASPSAIGDAMILAGETLGSREGRVIVISDFINTDGMDPLKAKSVLESKRVIVDMINTADDEYKENAGFVNLEVDSSAVTAFIKNYNARQIQGTVTAGSFSKDVTIPAQAIETVSFATPQEPTQVNFDYADDFPVDNTVYIATPEHDKITVLLISNNESVFVHNALLSLPNVEVEFAKPPIVPTGRFDVFVLHRIAPNSVLPGTYENINDYVEEGSNLIINAQKEMDQLRYQDLLPVVRQDRAGLAFVNVEQTNTFTRDVEFGSVQSYWKTTNKPGTVTIASDGDNNTIIGFTQRGAGKVLYFGVESEASDFQLSPSFPIFWVKTIEFMVGRESIERLNVRTGTTAIFDTVQRVKTPGGTVQQSALMYEYAGLYEMPDKTIAANLLNEDEATINIQDVQEQFSERTAELKPVKEIREFSFEIPITFIVIALLFLELIYIKWRGDL